ncbi:MAG: ABC transporter ATP-binding protein [Eubacteriales bacterium]|nr:ABC transporter ATP-binding protein [Eubacteriales bacterium]
MSRDKEKPEIRQFIRGIARAEWQRIALIVTGRIVQSASYLFFVLITRALVNEAVAGNRQAILENAMLLCAVAVFQIALNYGIRWMDASTQNLALRRIRGRLYLDIMHKTQRSLGDYHSTVLLRRMTADLENVIAYPVTMIPGYISTVTGLLFSVGTLFWMNGLLPAILLSAGLVVSALGRFFQKKVKQNYREYAEAAEQTQAYYQESMANSLIVEVFQAQEQAAARADAFEGKWYGKWKRWYLYNQLLKTGASSFFQIGYVGAMVFCAFLLSGDPMFYGNMTAILQLVGQIQSPFSAFGDLMSARYNAQVSAARILEIAELPCEAQQKATDSQALYRDMDALFIDNVCFSYHADSLVLDQASAMLKKGDFVLVTGASGIGKSTLFKLLLGIYDDYTGSITLQKKDGSRVPLNASTRGLFAYVPQKNMIFSGTLRDNLCFLCGEVDDDALWEAVRLACTEDFIRCLPLGLDTVLGEQGLGLSEGQIQRLAIARALLKHAPILILDEATSALDQETERAVLQNIRRLDEKTLLLISHRTTSFALCDQEWHIQRGQIERRILPHDR